MIWYFAGRCWRKKASWQSYWQMWLYAGIPFYVLNASNLIGAIYQLFPIYASFLCEQNLREAIATYRNSILRQSDEMKREASLSFFVEYLERYYFLICFAVYVHSVSSAHQTKFSVEVSFSDWMRARPELYSILRRWDMATLLYKCQKYTACKNVCSLNYVSFLRLVLENQHFFILWCFTCWVIAYFALTLPIHPLRLSSVSTKLSCLESSLVSARCYIDLWSDFTFEFLMAVRTVAGIHHCV